MDLLVLISSTFVIIYYVLAVMSTAAMSILCPKTGSVAPKTPFSPLDKNHLIIKKISRFQERKINFFHIN
jgi:hypothetical protein